MNTSGSSVNSANRKKTPKNYSWVVKIRNTSEAVLTIHPLDIILTVALQALVSLLA